MTGKSYHNRTRGIHDTTYYFTLSQHFSGGDFLALAVVFFFLGRCIPNILKPPNQTCLVAGMASFSGDGLEPKGNPRGDTACRSPIAVNATQVPLKLEKNGQATTSWCQ